MESAGDVHLLNTNYFSNEKEVENINSLKTDYCCPLFPFSLCIHLR